MSDFRNILLCGVPRSGTTWVAKVLAHGASVKYIHEPDNERHNYLGFLLKKGVSRFPYHKDRFTRRRVTKIFEKADKGIYLESNGIPAKVMKKVYGLDKEQVENRISKDSELTPTTLSPREKQIFWWYNLLGRFNAFRHQNKRKLVKSVHTPLFIPALVEHTAFRIVLLFRHPAGVIASQKRHSFGDMVRPLKKQKLLYENFLRDYENQLNKLETNLEKAGAQIGFMYHFMEKTASDYKLKKVMFADLAADPVPAYRSLYQSLNLNWDESTERYIDSLNKKGNKFSVNRISKNQPDKWKEELSHSEIEQIRRGYGIFPKEVYSDFA